MNDSPSAIAIGASIGAIEALSIVLPALPAAYARSVLVVVHVPTDTKNTLAELFIARCRIAVKEAEDKEQIQAGTVYFAPADYHLLVEPDFTLSLSSEEPVHYSRPAIDVLFESAADVYGPNLTGIVLTGASSDGANGLRAICRGGGAAIVQAPETAKNDAMPRAALVACPSARALSLEGIAAILKNEIVA